MTHLRPCPKCWHDKLVRGTKVGSEIAGYVYLTTFIKCQDCNISLTMHHKVPSKKYEGHSDEWIEKAHDQLAKAWNERSRNTCHIVYSEDTGKYCCDICGNAYDPEPYMVLGEFHYDGDWCKYCGCRVVREGEE